jgi:hypothetical protein
MAIWRAEEWETVSGWHCNDTSDLGNGSSCWWHQARIWQMSPAAFIEFLIKEFKPDKISYDSGSNLLIFSWKEQNKMREYKNKVNAQARKVNYQI